MADEPKKGSKKKLIIAGVAVAALAGGYFLFMGGSPPPEEEAAATTTTEPVEGAVIEVGTLTANLADADELRYARVTFAVVLNANADSAAVGARVPLLQDAALGVVSDYTSVELAGSTGIGALRDDLTAQAQELFVDGEVLRVVLTEVIVQ